MKFTIIIQVLCKRLRAKTTFYSSIVLYVLYCILSIQNAYNKHVYKIQCKHYENSMHMITMYIEATLYVTVHLFKENVRNVL